LETGMLIRIHEQEPKTPLFALSERTSEQIFGHQDEIQADLNAVLEDRDLVWKTMLHYIPPILVEQLGRETIETLLHDEELEAYRNAIITKKLASLAFYKFGLDWEGYHGSFKKDPIGVLHRVV
jgi:glutamate dehydrogenase